MKVLVFQVWKSCFQHAANGYLVMHYPRAASEHYCLPQCAQKVCIRGLIQ